MFWKNVLFILLLSFFSSVLSAAPIPTPKPENLAYKAAGETPKPHIKPIGTGLHLSPQNAALYKEIFELQEQAQWKEADSLINRLTDLRLRGHVLYQRYMHATDWRASYDELRAWLDLYYDHPGANEIYSLANKRHEKGKPYPKKNLARRLIKGMMPELSQNAPVYKTKKRRSWPQQREVNSLVKTIGRDLRRTAPTRAYNRLNTERAAKYMDAVEFDQHQAKIAASYLYVGKLDKALQLSTASLSRSGKTVPLSGWVAGLTAWRLEDYASAYRHFQVTAKSNYASSWTKSAASYWASRSALKSGYFNEVSYWLNEAAEYDRTFYGLLALKSLNRSVHFNWAAPRLSAAHMLLLSKYPAARRAKLLVDASQPHLAGSELVRLHPEDNSSLKEALIAFALDKGLPSFAIRFAHIFRPDSQHFYDAALYPVGAWAPKGGYSVDRAYMHAIIRQESRFNHKAQNPVSRAMGLMQILPSTANGVMNTKRFSWQGRHALKDPTTNLTVGQNYLESLLKRPEINGDIFSLAMAYNAGPGNLRRWKRELAEIDDPLLFVELIPYAETRAYVERVVSNYWIYRMRMQMDTPTLNAVASGARARLPS